ncbi:hypothetical protein KL930_000596 [Ogataea haglerorum]|uniref:Zinc-regulated transporter 3 n=1 Tax=Ogataea haglerorum TaxID=1937702 RepID=A0AAN6DA37_9ASCO|nr:uncharacterized protein KL911_005311 [Ogataea haglerorum]KAG7701567.1 hypothetical protein KL951_000023 [Ogataea haglerorum]KAG7711381.1 hypothetical protein KL914_000023 [Ogataea haglerorum]KAG7712152.1 hypothetical protein KL950_000023 [Ogataea haglerorum]KAG7722203.1 hypothetical protein KL913_000023 [Ogataea haglerorum]KAG7723694.1 hypothetical protein KL949_000744 [Ogataea haglerorum]
MTDQGWVLVLLTAVTTIAGCLVVYTDTVYRVLFPRLYEKHPFNIQKNTPFLVATLSLSSGSLLFTSLNRLLSEADKYFEKLRSIEGKPALHKALLVTFFFVGIICCTLLNLAIHFFTNESIVHCVHDDESGHSDTEASDLESTSEESPLLIRGHKPHDYFSHHAHNRSSVADDDQQDYTIAPKKMSLVDLSLKTLKGAEVEGECLGTIDSCQEELIARHHLHAGKKSTHNELHFCTLPSEENLMFFDKDRELIVNKNEICSKFPELEVNSPLLVNVHETSSTHKQNGHSQHNHSKDGENHHGHEHIHNSDSRSLEHHHHHIQTPLSRLLSIGLQTVLAITIHKLPEGFIMYSTAQADPSLGFSIFLSMFIHNIVEGFTMTLPLCIALNSKTRAFFISSILGASAQPIGAVLGWIIFRGNLDLDQDVNLLLFGSLIAVTSGFLTYIGLQMITSAVGFGGKQERVLGFAFFGMFLISLSNILINKD